LHTGYKLANPLLFKKFYQKGMSQFLPFVITVDLHGKEKIN